MPTTPAPNDPLAALKDIHLPAPVDWWPLAPGWWVLIILVLAGLIAGVIYLRRHIKRNAYRRQALEQLQLLENTPERDSRWLQSLNELLKRCAQSAYPQGNTASLHGEKWRHFLQQQASKVFAAPEVLNLLSSGGYRSDKEISSALTEHANNLVEFSKQWINQHPRAIQQPAVNTTC